MKKIKHSFACYKNSKGETIGKVSECAKVLLNWGEIPIKLSNLRAQEIGMLAQQYLRLEKFYKKHRKKGASE